MCINELDMAEERLLKLEGITKETSKTEKKRQVKKREKISKNYGTIQNVYHV